MKIITIKSLIAHKACNGLGFKTFRRIFPKGAELTEDNLRLAIEEGLPLAFLANRFLSAENFDEYETAYWEENESFDFWKKYLLKPLQRQKSFYRCV